MNIRLPIAIPLLVTLLCLVTASAVAASERRFTGENPLGVSRAEFRGAQVGLELIYQRDYARALQHFEAIGVDFPDSPLGPVGREIIWQARKFEEGSDAYDRAYATDKSDAERLFSRARRSGRLRGWTDFLEAVHQGLAAIADAREERYLGALNKAWDAMENIKQVERLHPDFQDVQLALGLYNYWRTVYADRVEFLPSFGDRRAEGIAQMLVAKEQGLLSPGPASLALSYTYIDQRAWDAAAHEAQWAFDRYPGNLINSLTLGYVHKRQREYRAARRVFQHAVQLAPRNARAWGLLARELERQRDLRPRSVEAYETYLGLEQRAERRAWAQRRLAAVERRIVRDARREPRRSVEQRSHRRISSRKGARP